VNQEYETAMRTVTFSLVATVLSMVFCRVVFAQDVSNWGNWPGGLATFSNANIARSGQPVIPIFEGWYTNPDGTVGLSFGYLNLNLQETLDIPLGPDNFIEPRLFDGGQPTHFMPAPTDNDRRHRHHSVFVVTIPSDYKADVIWTLRVRGQTFSVPGRATVASYGVEDLQSLNDSPIAPELRFRDGERGRGRAGPVTGPMTVAVGEPMRLSVGVDVQPASVVVPDGVYGPASERRKRTTVTWYHHQGPGEVTFNERETVLEFPEGATMGEATTTATFSRAGEYLLRVMANESPAAFVQFCCWTNGFVRVIVTP
jgi:hypothetical protein